MSQIVHSENFNLLVLRISPEFLFCSEWIFNLIQQEFAHLLSYYCNLICKFPGTVKLTQKLKNKHICELYPLKELKWVLETMITRMKEILATNFFFFPPGLYILIDLNRVIEALLGIIILYLKEVFIFYLK